MSEINNIQVDNEQEFNAVLPMFKYFARGFIVM